MDADLTRQSGAAAAYSEAGSICSIPLLPDARRAVLFCCLHASRQLAVVTHTFD
jgi:hypothetical protein